MANTERRQRKITDEDQKLVKEWVKSTDGRDTLRESQKRITEDASQVISTYSLVEPSLLKEPYTL